MHGTQLTQSVFPFSLILPSPDLKAWQMDKESVTVHTEQHNLEVGNCLILHWKRGLQLQLLPVLQPTQYK